MSYHTRDERLIKGVGQSIVERDEKGNIIGAYTGYWNPSKQLITLYPDYRHPAVKAGTKLNKRKIYDGMVRCKRSESSTKVEAPKGEGKVKSQTSRAMRDVMGQLKIKL